MRQSMSELIDNWKRKEYGTGSIKHLLEAKSGQYSALPSIYSKRSEQSSRLIEKMPSSLNDEEQDQVVGSFKMKDTFISDDDSEDVAKIYRLASEDG